MNKAENHKNFATQALYKLLRFPDGLRSVVLTCAARPRRGRARRRSHTLLKNLTPFRRTPSKMRVNVRLLQRIIALTLAVVLGAGSASAGLLVRETEGITMTGADGVRYEGASGITMTGADALLSWNANGITMTGADGITMTGADQILPVSPDGMAYTGTDSVRAT